MAWCLEKLEAGNYHLENYNWEDQYDCDDDDDDYVSEGSDSSSDNEEWYKEAREGFMMELVPYLTINASTLTSLHLSRANLCTCGGPCGGTEVAATLTALPASALKHLEMRTCKLGS